MRFALSHLELLPLDNIAHRCAQESELFFRRKEHDPRFCFELFRRAIVQRLAGAWELIYVQYQPLVSGWVKRHPCYLSTNEEVAYFVNRAFERMWSALTPDKFSHFADLKAVLRYLQMCVHSVIIDYTRATKPAPEEEALETALVPGERYGSPVEEQAMARMQRQGFWDCLTNRLHDEKERCVLYGSFVLSLKPQELQAAYQGTFQDVAEVYRVKQNVLERLRRDPEVKKFLGLGV